MGKTLFSGIYKIRNIINNKIYIGSTTMSFKDRWKAHLYQLKGNRHFNPYLQRSWNKYGEKNFEFTIVEIVKQPKKTLKREQYYLDTLKPDFNINITAGSNLGMKHSDEAKKKISKRFKGVPKSKEHIEKVRLAQIGQKRGPRSAEAKAKTSKKVVAISWSENSYTVYPSCREASRQLKIDRAHIYHSVKNKYKLKTDFIFILEKDFDKTKNLRSYFPHYIVNKKLFLTLKEVGKYLNRSETTAFRKVQSGEVIYNGIN